jgi:hypothetical protein
MHGLMSIKNSELFICQFCSVYDDAAVNQIRASNVSVDIKLEVMRNEAIMA